MRGSGSRHGLEGVAPGAIKIGFVDMAHLAQARIHILFPEKEFMPAKTRALINFLLEEMPPIIHGK